MRSVTSSSLGVLDSQNRVNTTREREIGRLESKKVEQGNVKASDDAAVAKLRTSSQREEGSALDLARSLANRIRREGGAGFMAQTKDLTPESVARNLA